MLKLFYNLGYIINLWALNHRIMLKKILIGVGVVVAVLAIAFLYLNNRNRTLSPPGEASLSNAGLEVAVSYSRPSVRGRVIFGRSGSDALLPYGKYWRLGANEPTRLTVGQSFSIMGQNFEAGSYDLYAIPQEGKMDMRFNAEERVWGFTEPNAENEVAQFDLPVHDNIMTEQFTIETVAASGGVDVVFSWEAAKWTLPIRK